MVLLGNPERAANSPLKDHDHYEVVSELRRNALQIRTAADRKQQLEIR
jgi:hypothetical protein